MEVIEGTTLCNSQDIPFKTTDGAVQAQRRGGYDAVRYNATKHGILSKLVVLAHKDHDDFGGLLAALVDEHQPAGMTEQHLVEELAAIIRRKRRVLLAEGARINDGLKSVLRSTTTRVPAAAPFQSELSGEHVDLPRLLNATAERIVELQHEAELDLAATRKAAAILAKGGPNAYEKARRACFPGRAIGGTSRSVRRSTRAPSKAWRSSFVNRSNRCALVWCGMLRRSRRRLWAPGCRRIDWKT